ncbi:MAG: hypothetical protein HQ518_31870 [Rhodopirellula sp.]|nr:hypothetical protein [Rhodopirellula sp.]
MVSAPSDNEESGSNGTTDAIVVLRMSTATFRFRSLIANSCRLFTGISQWLARPEIMAILEAFRVLVYTRGS